MTDEINVEIVNGSGNTVNVDNAVDAPITVNGVDNIINYINSLEGNFTNWTKLFSKLITGFANTTIYKGIIVDNNGNIFVYCWSSNTFQGIGKITVGGVMSVNDVTEQFSPFFYSIQDSFNMSSILYKYLVVMQGTGDTAGFRVYKDGVPVFTSSSPTTKAVTDVCISPNGKYIVVVGYDNNYVRNISLYEGS